MWHSSEYFLLSLVSWARLQAAEGIVAEPLGQSTEAVHYQGEAEVPQRNGNGTHDLCATWGKTLGSYQSADYNPR